MADELDEEVFHCELFVGFAAGWSVFPLVRSRSSHPRTRSVTAFRCITEIMVVCITCYPSYLALSPAPSVFVTEARQSGNANGIANVKMCRIHDV